MVRDQQLKVVDYAILDGAGTTIGHFEVTLDVNAIDVPSSYCHLTAPQTASLTCMAAGKIVTLLDAPDPGLDAPAGNA